MQVLSAPVIRNGDLRTDGPFLELFVLFLGAPSNWTLQVSSGVMELTTKRTPNGPRPKFIKRTSLELYFCLRT